MSNEELAIKIQQGNTELLGTLWDRLFLLVCKKANQFHEYSKGRGGLEIEDLTQIGFLAMVEAAETYNPQLEAKFATWLCIYLRKCFQIASGRLYEDSTGQTRPKDALDCAISLHTPIGNDDEAGELMEIVAAPSSVIDDAEENVWRQQLRCAVNEVLNTLPEDQRRALQLRYWNGLTFEQAAEEMDTTDSAIQALLSKALKTIRNTKRYAHLRPFVDFSYYCGTGLSSYKHTGMSVQERYMLKQERINENTFDSLSAATSRDFSE